MAIYGRSYPLKDMVKKMENDPLDELYNSIILVFLLSEVVQKGLLTLHKSGIIIFIYVYFYLNLENGFFLFGPPNLSKFR